MAKFNELLGVEIRNRRTERGMKQTDLVARYELLSGNSLTCSQLSQWENGKLMMNVEQFHFICMALDCSPSTIMPYQDNIEKRQRVANEVSLLPSDIVDVIYYAITSWYGNTKALWKFIGLYISLPNRLRQSIAEIGCIMYKAGKETKQLNSKAPVVDIAYLEHETKRLW